MQNGVCDSVYLSCNDHFWVSSGCKCNSRLKQLSCSIQKKQDVAGVDGGRSRQMMWMAQLYNLGQLMGSGFWRK